MIFFFLAHLKQPFILLLGDNFADVVKYLNTLSDNFFCYQSKKIYDSYVISETNAAKAFQKVKLEIKALNIIGKLEERRHRLFH